MRFSRLGSCFESLELRIPQVASEPRLQHENYPGSAVLHRLFQQKPAMWKTWVLKGDPAARLKVAISGGERQDASPKKYRNCGRRM